METSPSQSVNPAHTITCHSCDCRTCLMRSDGERFAAASNLGTTDSYQLLQSTTPMAARGEGPGAPLFLGPTAARRVCVCVRSPPSVDLRPLHLVTLHSFPLHSAPCCSGSGSSSSSSSSSSLDVGLVTSAGPADHLALGQNTNASPLCLHLYNCCNQSAYSCKHTPSSRCYTGARPKHVP